MEIVDITEVEFVSEEEVWGHCLIPIVRMREAQKQQKQKMRRLGSISYKIIPTLQILPLIITKSIPLLLSAKRFGALFGVGISEAIVLHG